MQTFTPSFRARAQIFCTGRMTAVGDVNRDGKVNGADLDRRLAILPGVASLGYDRAFPNTLRLTIRAERPVLVLRRGAGRAS